MDRDLYKQTVFNLELPSFKVTPLKLFLNFPSQEISYYTSHLASVAFTKPHLASVGRTKAHLASKPRTHTHTSHTHTRRTVTLETRRSVQLTRALAGGDHLPDEQRLLWYILRNYDPASRPVYNASRTVTVKFGYTLTQIADMVCTRQRRSTGEGACRFKTGGRLYSIFKWAKGGGRISKYSGAGYGV